MASSSFMLSLRIVLCTHLMQHDLPTYLSQGTLWWRCMVAVIFGLPYIIMERFAWKPRQFKVLLLWVQGENRK